MNRFSSGRLLALATLAALVTLAVRQMPADERGEGNPNEQQVRGVLLKVDAKVGTLTVITGEPGTEKVFNLSNKVTVKIDDRDGKLDDLPERSFVLLVLNKQTEDVLTIRAEGRTIKATIKRPDPATGSIVLSGEGRERNQPVAKDVRVLIDGAAAKLADIKPDSYALLRLSASGTEVVGITIGRGVEERRDPGARGERDPERPVVRARLKSLDAQARKVTVIVGVEEQRKEETYDLSKDATVRLGRRELPLTDLKPGQALLVFFTPDRKSVVQLTPAEDGPPRGERERDRPTVRGQIKTVDAKARKLTLRISGDAGFTEQTLELAEKVEVKSGRRALALEDLKEGQRVVAYLNPDRKLVVEITATEDGAGRERERDVPGVQGVVKSVDANARTLVVTVQQERQPVERTFTLTERATVQQGRRVLPLADLKPGTPVLLRLSEDRKSVATIQITAEGRDRE